MEKKTIKINPAFLSVSNNGGGSKTTTKKKSKKVASGGIDTKLKQKLLSRIDEFKKKQIKTAGSSERQNKQQNQNVKVVETNNFDDTLSFLERLANDNKNTNTTDQNAKAEVITTPTTSKPAQQLLPSVLNRIEPQIKLPAPIVTSPAPIVTSPAPIVTSPAPVVTSPAPVVTSPEPISQPINVPPRSAPNIVSPPPSVQSPPVISIPFEITSSSSITPTPMSKHPKTLKIKPPPPYGCIKGGRNPTYREWKRRSGNDIQKSVGQIQTNNKPSIRSEKLSNIKREFKEIHKRNRPRIMRKKLRTIKYKLGKMTDGKSNGKIAVLIKNQNTRKKIKREYGILKREKITDVRKYLKKHNLIKGGSLAPNDVLKTMYENAILAGDVTNKSADTLIHNFLN